MIIRVYAGKLMLPMLIGEHVLYIMMLCFPKLVDNKVILFLTVALELDSLTKCVNWDGMYSTRTPVTDILKSKNVIWEKTLV